MSALFEQFYNDGLQEHIFLVIHNWPKYFIFYINLRTTELHWNFSSLPKNDPEIPRFSNKKGVFTIFSAENL